jgi:hypothetical protein
MLSLLKHKMLLLTLKISLYMAPTCFGPYGPSSGSIQRNLAKVTVFVEIISKKYIVKIVAVQWQYVLQFVVCVLGAVRCAHAAQHPVGKKALKQQKYLQHSYFQPCQ